MLIPMFFFIFFFLGGGGGGAWGSSYLLLWLFLLVLFFCFCFVFFCFFWGGGGRRMSLICYDVLCVLFRFEIILNPKFGVRMHRVFVECRVPFECYCDPDYCPQF